MSTPSAAFAMDRMYRRQRHVYNLSRKYYLLGRDRLIRRLDAAPGHRVLEIGCGTGRNLVCAAKRYPESVFYGVDVSREMLSTAEMAIRRADLDGRIHVAFADAMDLNPQVLWRIEGFDRIFISYTLSMIPTWRETLQRAALLLAPHGELHIVDFGGQEGWPLWFRAGLRKWLAAFGVVPVDELEAELPRLPASRWDINRPYRGYAQYVALVRTA